MERILASGTTTLDRLHQAMLLFGRGHTALLGQFLEYCNMATEERFWTELVDRAIQLDLGRTLWHALRYAKLALADGIEVVTSR